ncbi:MAG: glycosyltransferase [Candidatus Omnitrophota bacterium]
MAHTRKIKVLHAITRLDRGGSSENTLLSVIGLSGKDYEVDLMAGRTENVNERLIKLAENSGVRIIFEEDLIRDIHPLRDLIAFLKIFAFIRKNKYDIIHAHSHKAGLLFRAAGRLAGVKALVYTPHGHVFYAYFGKIVTGMVILAEKLAALFTDSIIGLTDSECAEWLRFGIGRKEQYTSIPSGLDFAMLEEQALRGENFRTGLGIPDDSVLIGSIGRFTEIKGYDYFIDAAISQIRKRDNVYFLLAGEGALKKRYEEKIISAGAEKRFFVKGWQKNAGPVLKSLDVFVLSSLNEGMGRVIIEAMFFKKPVIATCVGGVPSVMSGNVGILIKPGSAEAVFEAIDKLLDNRESAVRMGQAGYEKARKEYSSDLMVDRLDKLYRRFSGDWQKNGKTV